MRNLTESPHLLQRGEILEKKKKKVLKKRNITENPARALKRGHSDAEFPKRAGGWA